MDPALCGHATGDGEQTIGKIQTYGERRRFIIARVAQLVEHNLAKVGVASSNLVSRSTLAEVVEW
jgi:hypothetical protein